MFKFKKKEDPSLPFFILVEFIYSAHEAFNKQTDGSAVFETKT